MNNKFTTTKAENAPTEKRVWQTPTIEVISRDNIQSGSKAGSEGHIVYIGINTYLGNES